MKVLLISAVFILTLYSIMVVFSTPKAKRNWAEDQAVLTNISVNSNQVKIKNIRNFLYRSPNDFDAAYYDQQFNLDELETAWFIVEPFGKFGVAHTFVSFGFKDGSYLAISVEVHREKGEEFGVLKGMLRQFELVYIIGSEEDLIKLRTNYRKNEVKLYPINADKQKLQVVFLDMLNRAQGLSINPEFYNTITSNCISNLVKHVRKFSDKNIPKWDISYLLPEYSDKVAFDLGLIETNLSIDEARQHFSITSKAQNCSNDENFSVCIRIDLFTK